MRSFSHHSHHYNNEFHRAEHIDWEALGTEGNQVIVNIAHLSRCNLINMWECKDAFSRTVGPVFVERITLPKPYFMMHEGFKVTLLTPTHKRALLSSLRELGNNKYSFAHYRPSDKGVETWYLHCLDLAMEQIREETAPTPAAPAPGQESSNDDQEMVDDQQVNVINTPATDSAVPTWAAGLVNQVQQLQNDLLRLGASVENQPHVNDSDEGELLGSLVIHE